MTAMEPQPPPRAAPATRVRQHFDRDAARFDLIYSDRKSPAQRLVDRLCRGVVRRRLAIALARCGDVRGQRVLDVGCGSGRYCVAFAQRGAEVVGIDFAPGMLALARAAAAAARVAERCCFVEADFLTWAGSGPFDIGLAMGFFDYVEQPEAHVAALARHVRGRVFCSFPALWTLRTPTRWLRLRLAHCPVHFYTRGRVEGLFGGPPWAACRVERVGRDYLVEARTDR